MSKKEINLQVKKDGETLDPNDVPDLSSLNLVGAEISLNGDPVKVWNDMGEVAYEWRGARSYQKWEDPAGVLLENLSLMAESFG